MAALSMFGRLGERALERSVCKLVARADGVLQGGRCTVEQFDQWLHDLSLWADRESADPLTSIAKRESPALTRRGFFLLTRS